PSCSARRPWPSPAGGSTESHHDKATTRRGGPVDVSMPQLGETVTEGTITRWLKQVGDRVEADEPLFEVSTDKVDSEVPAALAGCGRRVGARGEPAEPLFEVSTDKVDSEVPAPMAGFVNEIIVPEGETVAV